MLLVDTLKLHIRDYYLYGAFIRILFGWHYKAGIWSAKAVRYGCCRKRAYSSVSQSAPLIRVRSVVQLHIGPPVIYIWTIGDIAQLGERLLCKQEVVSSILTIPTR